MEPIARVGAAGGDTPAAGRSGAATRVRETAEEFEGVFLGLLMKAMRPSGGKGGLFAESADTQAYREFFDQEIGRSLARAGGIGLAQLVLRDQALREAAAPKGSAGALPEPAPATPHFFLKGSPGATDTPNDRSVSSGKGGSGEDQQ